jgi:hypothetical protein
MSSRFYGWCLSLFYSSLAYSSIARCLYVLSCGEGGGVLSGAHWVWLGGGGRVGYCGRCRGHRSVSVSLREVVTSRGGPV